VKNSREGLRKEGEAQTDYLSVWKEREFKAVIIGLRSLPATDFFLALPDDFLGVDQEHQISGKISHLNLNSK
jgi:hypothetical protein